MDHANYSNEGSLAALGHNLQQNVQFSPLFAKTRNSVFYTNVSLSVCMNKERADEHPIIFSNFPVYYFTFYHECPVLPQTGAVQFFPVFFKKVQKDFLKSSQLLYFQREKYKKKYGKLNNVHLTKEQKKTKKNENEKKYLKNKNVVQYNPVLPYIQHLMLD